MPQRATRIVQWVLRTTGLYRRQFSGGPRFPAYQAKALAVPSVPSAKDRARCHVEEGQFDGIPVWTISPKDRAATVTMLYWHGGGYVYPPAAVHWSFLAEMAATHGWRCVAPLYPLAPMHYARQTTDHAFAFYRQFVDRDSGQPFAMGGDSAGGGLAAATAMRARDSSLPLPDRLLLICPWLDVHATHPDQPAIARRDAILTVRGIREAGAHYAATLDTKDPRVSPLFGDWQGLPPIQMFGGSDDLLVVDARRLKEKLPSVSYSEGEGLIHDWPIFTFAESRAAQQQMADWVAS